MLTKRITLRDVAERLGVSHTTVAMALRNHHTISIKRREQVRRMAEKMGYRPDPLLSSLAAYRSHNNPVKMRGVVAWINHWQQPKDLKEKREYEGGIWQGASKAANRFGYRLNDIHWSADCSAKRYEQILLARGVRGVLIPPHLQIPDWGEMDWSKFSIVRFGLSVPHPDSNLVSVDHFRAIVMAVQRIHDYGYRRIGFVVGGNYNFRLGGSNIGGFLSAMDMLKIKPVLPPLNTEYGNYSPAEMKMQKLALQKWLTKYAPEAILTTDAEIPGFLRELGYQIPKDIAVAGTTVHDIPLDAGIEQHSEAVGRIAMETLAKQMNINECGEPADPTRILVEARWQDGKSLPIRR